MDYMSLKENEKIGGVKKNCFPDEFDDDVRCV